MVWFAFIGLLIMTVVQVIGVLIFPIGWSRKGEDAGSIVVKVLIHLLVLSIMVTSLVLVGGLL